MDKTLISSEKDYINFFIEHDIDFSYDEIESLLGIEFAFEDGTFHSDMFNGVNVDEDQDINPDVYRKREDCLFPESYPCIMVHCIDNDHDRFGKVAFRMFDFVYPKDFNVTT